MDFRQQRTIDLLGGRFNSGRAETRCPACGGSKRCVWDIKSDRLVGHCMSGESACQDTINRWIGEHIEPPSDQSKRGRPPKDVIDASKWLPDADTDEFVPDQVLKYGKKKGWVLRDRYFYQDRDGRMINYVVLRYEPPEGGDKYTTPYTFREYEHNGLKRRWLNKGPSEPQWYGLELLDKRDKVLLVEGQKAVKKGIEYFGESYAVMTLGGSGNMCKADPEMFKGKEVILWPDWDEPGFGWAFKKPDNLYDKFVAAEIPVKVVMWDGGHSSDVADIDNAHSAHDILRTAGGVDEYKLETLYSECLAATDLSMTNEVAKAIPCGSLKQCDRCKWSNIPACSHPIQVISLSADPVLYDHAYLANEKAYICLSNLKQKFDVSSFNSYYAHLPGYKPRGTDTPSYTFENTPGALRLFNRDFLPNQPMVVDNTLNIWQPLAYEETNVDPDEWLMCLYNWATNEEAEHILDHMAFTVQVPEHKINWMPIVIGTTGIGKSMFFNTFFKGFQRARQFTPITYEMIMGGFNGGLVGAKVGSIEEAMASGGGYKFENNLKPYASSSGEVLYINEKYGAQFPITNIISVYGQSNNEIPFKLSAEDRRWFVVDSRPRDIKDISHCRELTPERYKHMKYDDSYIDKVLSYLHRRDISQFDYGGRAPDSAGKDRIIKESVPMYREIAPLLEDIDWHPIVTLHDVQYILSTRYRTKIGANQLSKVMETYGWTRYDTQVRVGNNKIRPWFTERGDMWTASTGMMIKDQWVKQKMHSTVATNLSYMDDHR